MMIMEFHDCLGSNGGRQVAAPTNVNGRRPGTVAPTNVNGGRSTAINTVGINGNGGRPGAVAPTVAGCRFKTSLLVCALALAASAFEIPAPHLATASPAIREIIECRFENAMRIADSARSADGKNAMAAVLHLVAIGMRDVDADRTVDSAAFIKSYTRAIAAVDEYEKQHGKNSYVKTLRGFTLGIHASFHVKNKSYIAAAGTGMDAIKMMREAREANPENTEVNFFLGLYDYALADLKKRMAGVAFWLPGNKQSGVKQLEECAQTAKLTNIAAKLALSDIYLQEKQQEKSREIIYNLKKELPNSRFLLWAEAKYFEDQKMFGQAAKIYGRLADSYEKDKNGMYNSIVTRNKQAHAHNKAGEKEAARGAGRRGVERAGGAGNDKELRDVVKDTEKLLGKLGK